ncbi:twin-arginine translocase TatA/TatE family subunit [Occultella glacieicola]|uniref:Sec-independent protein translocase protein TatA n=1 Tax=Occultella glacieicola TaxID=2518684 RepID=A0ABY2E1P6_9MICO|nr:Sec-independent protein translocase subunit TatA [Occultella glacieicola]TDE92517.1 twin-arginine translocase TatA/TatE family subunit [Occultella glacieicola]
MRLQPVHLIILLVLVLLIFGAAKLPDITRNVGKSMKIFKQEVKELRDDTDPNQPPATGSDATPPAAGTDAPTVTTPPQQGGGGTPPGSAPGDTNR